MQWPKKTSKRNKEGRYGFVYIWRDRKHNRYYIGCHWGSIDDGYVCSSDWMRNAYRKRPEDFKRRILISNIETRHEMHYEEYRYMLMIKDHELGSKYYNLRKWKFGHWTAKPDFTTTIAKLSAANKGQRRSKATEFKPGEHRSPLTEFKPGQSAHNKGKTMADQYGEERATQIKKIKSVKMAGRSNSPATQFVAGNNVGAANIKARSISTPFGTFDTIQQAIDVVGITRASIQHKLRSVKNTEWQYVTK